MHDICVCVLGTDTLQIKEEYLYRKDCLLQRTQQTRSGEIVDTFGPGRPGGLKGINRYKEDTIDVIIS